MRAISPYVGQAMNVVRLPCWINGLREKQTTSDGKTLYAKIQFVIADYAWTPF